MVKLEKTAKNSLLVLIAAVLWSSAGVLIRGADAGPFWVLFIRHGIAGIFLVLLSKPKKIVWNRDILRVCCFYTAFVVCFIVSTKWVGAAQTVGGQYAAPIYAFGFLLVTKREAFKLKTFIPMLIIAIGIVVQILTGSVWYMSLLPILCGILFPLYTWSVARCVNQSMYYVMGLANLTCALVATPFLIGSEVPNLLSPSIVMLGLGGILLNGVAYVIFGKGVQGLSVLNSTLICLVEPVLSPIWVFIFLGEAMKPVEIFSIAMIILGTFIHAIVQWHDTKQHAKAAEQTT